MDSRLIFVIRRSALVAFLLLLSLQLRVLGDDAKASPIDSGLAAASKLYRAGKFAEAEASYESLLKTDANLVPAQVGLIRTMLAEGKVNEAVISVNAALAKHPNSAALLAVTGDIQFRKGEMSDAEKWYLAALERDPNDVSAHLGLARWYTSSSMYRKAYDQLQTAREIAPDDFAVQVAWVSTLPQKQRRAAIEAYLNTAHPDHEDERLMTEYLEFLKTTSDESIHPCRLVSKSDETETKLEAIRAENSRRMRGIGLSAKVNNVAVLLQFDTGASGIVVDRKVAEKAGVSRISAAHLRGIGDHGQQNGYRAVAARITIGELEFQDCVVLVTEKPRPEFHGLIGADVFGSYLVDVDLPEMRLKLSPLPKRPEDALAATSLNSETGDPANVEQEKDSTSEQISMEQNASTSGSKSSPQRLPKDRYIAPEMVNWTQVFRFGHMMLVPTNVNGSKPMLFLLDSGSPGDVLSTRAGEQVSTVHAQSRMGFTGLSGRVNNVYISSEATMRFGHVEQRITDITTFDLSSIGGGETEVSGLLGFATLKLLDVKLDYRDGLVHFEYDPRRGKR